MSRAESRHRYDVSEKGRARHRRFNATRTDERNGRMVWVGRNYVGTAPSTDIADQLNREAKERFR